MQIYVAAKAEDYERAREVQKMCQIAGHTITYDWTVDVERFTPGAPELDRAEQAQLATSDVNGTRSCDLLIACIHPRWTGTLVEIGIALFLTTPVWLLGDWEDLRPSIFWSLSHVTHVPSDDDLTERLRLIG